MVKDKGLACQVGCPRASASVPSTGLYRQRVCMHALVHSLCYGVSPGQFIIARLPEGAPVTDRAIPVAIFSAEPAIRKVVRFPE